jgi:hypothetical protein
VTSWDLRFLRLCRYRLWPSCLRLRVVLYVLSTVSKERVTTVFRSISVITRFLSLKMIGLWDVVPSSLAEVYRRFSTSYCLHHHKKELWLIMLTVEAISASKTSVSCWKTTRCNIPKYYHLHTRRPDNLDFQIINMSHHAQNISHNTEFSQKSTFYSYCGNSWHFIQGHLVQNDNTV